MDIRILSQKPSSTDEGAVLSQLWRNIINDMSLREKIPYMISLYLKKPNSKTLPSKKKTKAGIVADVVSDNMSWKVFLNIMFNVLRVRSFRLTIDITHANGTESTHEVNVKNFQFKSDDNVE